jgi:hypothetical protein
VVAMFIIEVATVEERMVATIMDILDQPGTTATVKDTYYCQQFNSILATSDHPLCSDSITTVAHL